MTVDELNRKQLIQLKQNMLIDRKHLNGESPSWGDLIDVDFIVSDEEVYNAFSETEFSIADFWN